MSGIFILAAKRTPFGAFGGALKQFSATDLGVHAAKAALAAVPELAPASVPVCVFGNVAQTSPDAAYLARHVGLRAGLDVSSTALTVNRLCGSGFQSLLSAAAELREAEALGGADAGGAAGAGTALIGGTESMSQAPLAVYGADVRFGHRMGTDMKLLDTLWAGLTDSHCATAMGATAENVADVHGVDRAACDAYAARSQAAWAAAQARGAFAAELAPVPLPPAKRGGAPGACAVDEHPRPDTTAASLAKLPTLFRKEGGRVTAGSASGICDGAAALVIATGAAVQRRGFKPLARVVAWAVAGVDPKLMGLGPAPAIKLALARAGLRLSQIDRVEVNEAFAAQVLAVEAAAGLDRARLNADGGAIALGHPLGASGARILGHLAHAMAAAGERYAIGSACIGGGQGIAVILENVNAAGAGK